MSLIESLCRLREELPLARRAAPKRILLEHYLQREHVLLRQLSVVEAVSADLRKHDEPCSFLDPPHAACLSGTNNCGGDRQHLMVSHSNRVEDIFQKARLKHCFARIMQHRRGADENLEQRRTPVVAPQSPSAHIPHPQGTESTGTLGEETREELDGATPREPSRAPQLALFHPGSTRYIAEESRSIERPAEEQPHASPEPSLYRDASQGEAERIQRRILLRRFFHTARRRDIGRGGQRLDLGNVSGPAAAGGAPCFTVGGNGRGIALEGQQGHDGTERGDLVGPEGVGLRRADLLRRILHAMRESVRERGTEADTSTAPPSPASLDLLPRPPGLPTVQRRWLQNEQHSAVSIGPQQVDLHLPPPPPRGDIGLNPPTGGRELPAHPRQEIRIGTAHQAVFEAFARLLPPSAEEEGWTIGSGAVGARMEVMRAAAVRCGLQCQGYIRALQHGIEVVRRSPTGENIRSSLTLQPATADGSHRVSLTLRDINASPEVVAAAGAEGGVVTRGNVRPTTPVPSRLPLGRVTRVMCLTGGDERDDLLRFAILASATSSGGGHGEEKECCSQHASGANQREAAVSGGVGRRGGDQTTEGEEVEPFGVLRAASCEDFCALVLGVASVKSALDSPFRTRQAPNAGVRGQQQQPGPSPTGSASHSSPTATAAAAAAAAAAYLPWQGARVCIAALAPSLTFLGAVRAVEAEARRVGRDNGISLRDQNLLICTSARQ